MPAIDQVDISGYALSSEDAASAKSLLRAAIWAWYHQHQDDVLFRKWFFTFHVRDVNFLFVALVGEE